eukprot:349615-Chlamydomonas_euryale.AAC.9
MAVWRARDSALVVGMESAVRMRDGCYHARASGGSAPREHARVRVCRLPRRAAHGASRSQIGERRLRRRAARRRKDGHAPVQGVGFPILLGTPSSPELNTLRSFMTRHQLSSPCIKSSALSTGAT